MHFVPGPSLAGENVRIFVNHPTDSKSGPNRHLYRELEWQNLSEMISDVYDNFAEIVLCVAGSFNYFFTIDGTLVSLDIYLVIFTFVVIRPPMLLVAYCHTSLCLSAALCIVAKLCL